MCHHQCYLTQKTSILRAATHVGSAATFAARGTYFREMNPTISSQFADKRLKTSTQLVAGLTITVTGVTSDVFGGNEFLVLKTQELGDTEGLAIGCFTKGRQGNYYNPDGTISEQRTMRYPQGTAVDAFKKVFAEVQALPEDQRTYGVLAERLRPVFEGKKIAITADNYVDRYGTERALRHFNFA